MSKGSGIGLRPEEKSILRNYRGQERAGVKTLFRSSLYCTIIAALFLYLALARDDPRYAIGIFGMFLLYLAIRVYSARRMAGIMPRIVQHYEKRIIDLEEQVKRIVSHRA